MTADQGSRRRDAATAAQAPKRGSMHVLTLVMVLSACSGGPRAVGDLPAGPARLSAEQLAREDLRAEVLADDAGAAAPPGGCWAREVLPARLESVTEQIPVSPAPAPAAAAGAAAPGSYRSETRQEILRDRLAVRFAVPCPGAMLDFATLQRALKVRGYYRGAVTGRQGMALAQAVRRYQVARGLDSATLSLAAARQLGLAAVPRDPSPPDTPAKEPPA